MIFGKWSSLDISAATRRGRQLSLLEITVETGFHSLVELIARHDSSQSSKDAARADATRARRLGLVELLLANGADIKSFPLADVLLTWEPKTIRFFPAKINSPILPKRSDLRKAGVGPLSLYAVVLCQLNEARKVLD